MFTLINWSSQIAHLFPAPALNLPFRLVGEPSVSLATRARFPRGEGEVGVLLRRYIGTLLGADPLVADDAALIGEF